MTQKTDDKINVFWFLPTHGDGRYLGTSEGGRPVDLPYLQQVALAADSLGYYGVLIPTGKSCEDSWLVASALAPLTRRLRYLVAVRPGLQPPTLAARMAATYPPGPPPTTMIFSLIDRSFLEEESFVISLGRFFQGAELLGIVTE